jgi:hypothetical protein
MFLNVRVTSTLLHIFTMGLKAVKIVLLSTGYFKNNIYVYIYIYISVSYFYNVICAE